MAHRDVVGGAGPGLDRVIVTGIGHVTGTGGVATPMLGRRESHLHHRLMKSESVVLLSLSLSLTHTHLSFSLSFSFPPPPPPQTICQSYMKRLILSLPQNARH